MHHNYANVVPMKRMNYKRLSPDKIIYSFPITFFSKSGARARILFLFVCAPYTPYTLRNTCVEKT